jgi:hypothetical protein
MVNVGKKNRMVKSIAAQTEKQLPRLYFFGNPSVMGTVIHHLLNVHESSWPEVKLMTGRQTNNGQAA